MFRLVFESAGGDCRCPPRCSLSGSHLLTAEATQALSYFRGDPLPGEPRCPLTAWPTATPRPRHPRAATRAVTPGPSPQEPSPRSRHPRAGPAPSHSVFMSFTLSGSSPGTSLESLVQGFMVAWTKQAQPPQCKATVRKRKPDSPLSKQADHGSLQLVRMLVSV